MNSEYIVEWIINPRDTCLEVCNYQPMNKVILYGWVNYKSYKESRDEFTVGVWKVKTLKD